jgi:hypothetical protein
VQCVAVVQCSSAVGVVQWCSSAVVQCCSELKKILIQGNKQQATQCNAMQCEQRKIDRVINKQILKYNRSLLLFVFCVMMSVSA